VKLAQVISEECCPQVLSAPLGAEEAEDVAAALRVVAILPAFVWLSLISNAEGREVCVCNLAAPLGLSQPTVSHHLKVLADARTCRKGAARTMGEEVARLSRGG
jgi:ArsR family transcriptional regulator, arsenate/arsenite/antimonite-responsive transcriptional repressor